MLKIPLSENPEPPSRQEIFSNFDNESSFDPKHLLVWNGPLRQKYEMFLYGLEKSFRGGKVHLLLRMLLLDWKYDANQKLERNNKSVCVVLLRCCASKPLSHFYVLRNARSKDLNKRGLPDKYRLKKSKRKTKLPPANK